MGVAFPTSANTLDDAPAASRLVWARRFRAAALPPPLARNSEHRQIWDNYLPETNLRLRKIRTPATNQYRLELAQKTRRTASDICAAHQTTVIPLSATAYNRLWPVFEKGGELRKNRYLLACDGREYMFDAYLGRLWGLILAQTFFSDEKAATAFAPPSFVSTEITADARFYGENLHAFALAEL